MKKIVYLDPMFISNLVKIQIPEFSNRLESNWKVLLDLLNNLVDQGLLICPASDIQSLEIAPNYENLRLKMLDLVKRLSQGLKFPDSLVIQKMQLDISPDEKKAFELESVTDWRRFGKYESCAPAYQNDFEEEVRSTWANKDIRANGKNWVVN